MVKVDASRFYGEYHGHLVEHLEVLLPALRESTQNQSTSCSTGPESSSSSENAPLIWTAGDSSLDNKYWFHDHRTAVGAYRDILDPPSMNADVTYWLNRLAIDRATAARINSNSNSSSSSNNNSTNKNTHMATINTAIEATTIQQRTWKLLAQDAFLRDNIHPGDTLIVSIGGNDVANAPTPCTIASMLCMVKAPQCCLEGPHIPCTCWKPPCNEHCWGCGPVSILACCTSMPPCLGYINHLFGTRTQHYIEALTAKTKPKRILVCMIYYLDETPTPSWASTALKCLGYDDDPERLQYLIRKFYVEATSKIQIQGGGNTNTTVIPVPLFDVLDGKTSGDYVSRVEPSSQGGKKMAEYLLDIIERDELRQQQNQQPHNSYHQSTHPTLTGSGPVESSYMLDRS
jgi:hypothetical protein